MPRSITKLVALARRRAVISERAQQHSAPVSSSAPAISDSMNVSKLVAERVAQAVEHAHAGERARAGADRQPQREPHVHRALAEVPPAADASW